MEDVEKTDASAQSTHRLTTPGHMANNTVAGRRPGRGVPGTLKLRPSLIAAATPTAPTQVLYLLDFFFFPFVLRPGAMP
jgi:hypothetical protein